MGVLSSIPAPGTISDNKQLAKALSPILIFPAPVRFEKSTAVIPPHPEKASEQTEVVADPVGAKVP